MQRTVLFCLFVLFSVGVHCNRDLKQLRINWSERDGFSLVSNLLDITVNDGDVFLDSSIGTLRVEDGDVVIDSQVFKLDTRQEITVKVENGMIMKFKSNKTGDVDMSLSNEDDELVTVRIRPKEDDSEIVGESVLVDFSNDGNFVTVSVGENGEIVNVNAATNSAQISDDKTIAKVSLTNEDVDLDINDTDRNTMAEKQHQNANSLQSEGVSYIHVSGSNVVSSSSQPIII